MVAVVYDFRQNHPSELVTGCPYTNNNALRQKVTQNVVILEDFVP